MAGLHHAVIWHKALKTTAEWGHLKLYFPYSSRRIEWTVSWLMHHWSSTNCRVIQQSLVKSSQAFATVSGSQAVDSSPILGTYSKSSYPSLEDVYKIHLHYHDHFKHLICFHSFLTWVWNKSWCSFTQLHDDK